MMARGQRRVGAVSGEAPHLRVQQIRTEREEISSGHPESDAERQWVLGLMVGVNAPRELGADE